MEISAIKELSRNWGSAKWKVIRLNNPGVDVVQQLFKDTYEVVELYSKEDLIPKEVSGLLLEMQEFCFWVADLEGTPIHYLYQEIITLVCVLNKYFLTRDASVDEIEYIINVRLIKGKAI